MATRVGTEQRLLDAADQVLFSRGVVSTPVDEVLRIAGASPATLYRAYGSKEGLVAAALARRHERWLRCWDGCLERADGPVERLVAVFDALEEFHAPAGTARWCAFLGTAAEQAEPSPEVRAVLDLESEVLRARLRDLAADVVPADRAGRVAELLVLLVSGELAMRLRGRDADAPRTRDVAVTLVERERL